MTAVDVDALDKLREALSEALGQLAMRGGYGIGVLASERLAADLLPVVDRIANQRAAAELEAAANDPELAHIVSLETDVGVFPHRVVAVADLYTHAAALRASNGEGT